MAVYKELNIYLRLCAGFLISGECLLLAYSVEKLEFFPGDKFIFDMRNYKILHTGRDIYLTICSDSATVELTY